MPTVTIKPHRGPQEQFLSTPAEICVYGGSAGSGKSYGVILEAARYAALTPVKGFQAVAFRQSFPQITQEGGLWSTSLQVYPLLGGVPRFSDLKWTWEKYHTSIRFSYLDHPDDVLKWQGSQVPLIIFDELTHFTETQFFYMLSRNRSTCGVRPYVRATTNPDADSWVKSFLAPWVDETYDGERAVSGEIRWFIREHGSIYWLPKGERHPDAKSVTFIAASIYDNPTLLEADPNYLKNLKALDEVEQRRLLYGDWTVRPSGIIYKREWFKKLGDVTDVVFTRKARWWDLAATEQVGDNDPDYTAGVLVGKTKDNHFVVLDVSRLRGSPRQVEALIAQKAEEDGKEVSVYMEREPGSGGVNTIDHYRRNVLLGYTFRGIKSTINKVERSKPVSSQCEGGNVSLLRAHWNDAFLNELVAFPTKGVHKDQVDAFNGVMSRLFEDDIDEHLSSLRSRLEVRKQHEQAQPAFR